MSPEDLPHTHSPLTLKILLLTFFLSRIDWVTRFPLRLRRLIGGGPETIVA